MKNLKKVDGKFVFNTDKLKRFSSIEIGGWEYTILGISDTHIHVIDEYGTEFMSVETYMEFNKIAF
ncbi:MAG: hypothetical protein ACI3T9_02250 [Romboutsia timonensis]